MSDEITGPVPLTDPLIGARLGEYEILEAVGEGGMGVVYRGIQPVIKKRVAIKVLKPHVASDASHVKRLVAEAEAVNSIGHRNIIDIFGLGQLPDGRPYVVMEYLEGQALDHYLAGGRQLPVHEALEVLADICSPLAAAHRAGVIHRDLKPSNVFLCQQADGARFVKLLDFGLAKRAVGLDGNTAQSSQALIAGTPDYMSPEQARGLPISPRTDIYALGVMAFELLAGEIPFSGQTPMDVMMRHVSAPIPLVSSLVPALPPQLVDLIFRMMAKAPEERPQSVDEVRNELSVLAQAVAPDALFRPMRTQSMPALQRVPSPLGGSPAVATPAPHEAPLVAGAFLLEQTLEAPPPEPSRPITSSGAAPQVRSPSSPSLSMGVRSASFEHLAPVKRRSLAPLVVLGFALVLGGSAVLLFINEPPQEAAAVEAPVATPPVAPAAPPVVTPTPAVAAPVVPAVAAPVAPAVEEPPERDRPKVRTTRHDKTEAVSSESLKARIVSLERTLRRQTAQGEEPDPTALQYLGKARLELSLASGAGQRRAVSRTLDQWEKTFLKH